jgi:signal transduction histidine kinase/DNA-binding response OmpR family regulator
MKLEKKEKDERSTDIKSAERKSKIERPPWKVLVVDDEPDVNEMTRFALKNFEFAGKQVQIFQAMSGREARDILAAEPDMAVALIDVVMETDDAGLQLVDFIRNELKYSLIRLIIRTGQSGKAPEKEVIERYDIDDYKNKTELKANKLYTALRVALKSYHDLSTFDSHQKALKKILDATPEFYHAQSLNQFFYEVLTQIIGLCNLGKDGPSATVNSGIVFTVNNNQVVVKSGTGRFATLAENPEVETITKICSNHVLGRKSTEPLPFGALLIPLEVHEKPIGFVYLENAQHLNQADLDLIHIMANQCATALENLQLYLDLKEANQQTLQMLEEAEQARQEAEQARQEAEQARQEAESANHVKSTFLANMSHEFRTPLHSLLGYTQFLQEDNSLNVRQQEDISVIQHSGNYLLTLIDDILELSEIEKGELKLYPNDFLLNKFIQEIVKLFQNRAEQNGISFIYQPLSQLPTVIHADNKRLRQILINLLSNAVKFTQQGGVTFRVNSEQLKGELSTLDSQRFTIHFIVADTGVGIPAEALEKIFLPFEQASDWPQKSEGAGLGLSLTKKLVEMMGGELHVESQLGKGSRFWFDLVFPEALEWMDSDPPVIVGYQSPRRKILVIDDHKENRYVLVEILKPLGFEICEAGDGLEGLEKVHEFKPDLIITDLVMPVMDGFEFIRKIRKLPEFQLLPILAESASVLEGYQAGEGMSCCNAFFSKPIRAKELLELLREHLGLTWIYKEQEGRENIDILNEL